MSIIDSLNVSFFSVTLVFLVLATLYGMVRLLTYVIYKIDKARTNVSVEDSEVGKDFLTKVEDNDLSGNSTGELKLVNVDEKTAAMIMAIISHESSTPLRELSFKLIKALD